jgi:hypothetical protein
VRFDTSKGAFVIELRRDCTGCADRSGQPGEDGFFDDTRARVISGFMVQFGINGDRNCQPWRGATIKTIQAEQQARIHHFCNSGPIP